MNVNDSESLNDAAGHGNQSLFDRAKKLIPGGVNSPVRAFGSVGGTPRFIRSAKGCRILDEDNREYIDFVGSWGPMPAWRLSRP